MLDTSSDDEDLPWFATKRYIEVYDQSGKSCYVNKTTRIETTMLRSDLCDYSDAYIVVKWTTTVTDQDNAKRNKSAACTIYQLHFKNQWWTNW